MPQSANLRDENPALAQKIDEKTDQLAVEMTKCLLETNIVLRFSNMLDEQHKQSGCSRNHH